MRIQPSVQIEDAAHGKPLQPFRGLDTGNAVTVRLTALSGLTAVLQTQDGKSAQAALSPGIRLLEGDVLTLVLEDRQNGRLSFRLLSVNGQNILPEASRLEQSLLRLGIAPTARNIRLAQLFRQTGHTPNPEIIGTFEKIVATAPRLPLSVAAFMAARGQLPVKEESRIFSQPGQLPDSVPKEPGVRNFYYLQFPVRLEKRDCQAGLFIFRDKDRDATQKEQTVIFIALHTQNLGRVEARLGYGAGGLAVHFLLRSERVQNYFSNHFGSLKEALTGIGLRLLGIRATISGDLPAADSPRGERHGGLDIQV